MFVCLYVCLYVCVIVWLQSRGITPPGVCRSLRRELRPNYHYLLTHFHWLPAKTVLRWKKCNYPVLDGSDWVFSALIVDFRAFPTLSDLYMAYLQIREAFHIFSWADISVKLSPVCPSKRNANLWIVILCTELMANKFELIWFEKV